MLSAHFVDLFIFIIYLFIFLKQMQSTVIILYLPFYYMDCVGLDPSYAVLYGAWFF